jgi:hypothetical protein
VFKAQLVSATSRGLDPLGHAVKVKKPESTIDVRIPRCRSCRVRSRNDSIIFVLFGAIGAAIALGVYWWFGEGSGSPPPFVIVDAELTKWLIGFAGVFVGALCAVPVIVRRQLPASRKYDDFPPVAALRAIGWDWPRSAD